MNKDESNMLNSITAVKVSDTTDDDSSNAACSIKINLIAYENYLFSCRITIELFLRRSVQLKEFY